MQGNLILKAHWSITFVMNSIKHIFIKFFELIWYGLSLILACWVILHVLWMTCNHDIMWNLWLYHHGFKLIMWIKFIKGNNMLILLAFIRSIIFTYFQLGLPWFLGYTSTNMVFSTSCVFFLPLDFLLVGPSS